MSGRRTSCNDGRRWLLAAQAFTKETLDKVAEELRGYFRRKSAPRLSHAEARALIDHAGSPAPRWSSGGEQALLQPRVTGGGPRRPTDGEIEGIVQRAAARSAPSEWDEVFDELMTRHPSGSLEKRLILMSFRDGHGYSAICEELAIGPTTYFAHRRGILGQAAVIAVEKGALKP